MCIKGDIVNKAVQMPGTEHTVRQVRKSSSKRECCKHLGYHGYLDQALSVPVGLLGAKQTEKRELQNSHYLKHTTQGR